MSCLVNWLSVRSRGLLSPELGDRGADTYSIGSFVVEDDNVDAGTSGFLAYEYLCVDV